MCLAEEVVIHSGVVKNILMNKRFAPDHFHAQIIVHGHIHKLKSVAVVMKEFLLLIFNKKKISVPSVKDKSFK